MWKLGFNAADIDKPEQRVKGFPQQIDRAARLGITGFDEEAANQPFGSFAEIEAIAPCQVVFQHGKARKPFRLKVGRDQS